MLSRLREQIRRFYHYRSIRLTPDGTRFVLLTIAVGVAAINTGNNLLYLLLAMMLSLIVMSGVLSEQCLKGLEIHRRLPEHLFANRPATGVFTVANRKLKLASFSLRLLDVVEGVGVDRGVHLLHLAPRATILQSFPLCVTRRGRYRVEALRELTRFPFGLFIKTATVPLKSETVVYPELVPLADDLLRDLGQIGHEEVKPQRGHGTALHNLRGYQPGDDSRVIHWKTTARQGSLIVRETEAEDEQRATLALPTQVPEAVAERDGAAPCQAAFERAVSLTASLAAHLHARGYAIRLVVGAQDTRSGSGEDHFHRVLRALALCQCEPAGPGPIPEPVRTLAADAAAGALTLLILPWDDHRLAAVSAAVHRVIRA